MIDGIYSKMYVHPNDRFKIEIDRIYNIMSYFIPEFNNVYKILEEFNFKMDVSTKILCIVLYDMYREYYLTNKDVGFNEIEFKKYLNYYLDTNSSFNFDNYVSSGVDTKLNLDFGHMLYYIRKSFKESFFNGASISETLTPVIYELDRLHRENNEKTRK